MLLTVQWVNDIIQEFVYQFQGFCQYRCQVAARNAEELKVLQANRSVWTLPAVLKILEREGVVSRGHRGEGRYGITMLPDAVGHMPRSNESRVLLNELKRMFPTGARGSTELYLLTRRTGLDEERLRHALTLLERAGTMTVQRPFSGRTIAVLKHEPWSSAGIDLSRMREQERNQVLLLKRMTEYAYAKRCRRAFMMRYFGEEVPFGQSCGKCDVCKGPKLKLKLKLSLKLGAVAAAPARFVPGGSAVKALRVLPERYSSKAAEDLKRWRRELSADLGVPPFIIFNDATLYAIAAALPASRDEFMNVKGTGESRWERFGSKVLEICVMARANGDVPQIAAPALIRRRR